MRDSDEYRLGVSDALKNVRSICDKMAALADDDSEKNAAKLEYMMAYKNKVQADAYLRVIKYIDSVAESIKTRGSDG